MFLFTLSDSCVWEDTVMKIHELVEKKASGQTWNHLCNADDAAGWSKAMWQPAVVLEVGVKSAIFKNFYFCISRRLFLNRVMKDGGITLFCTFFSPLSSPGTVLTLFWKLGYQKWLNCFSQLDLRKGCLLWCLKNWNGKWRNERKWRK